MIRWSKKDGRESKIDIFAPKYELVILKLTHSIGKLFFTVFTYICRKCQMTMKFLNQN